MNAKQLAVMGLLAVLLAGCPGGGGTPHNPGTGGTPNTPKPPASVKDIDKRLAEIEQRERELAVEKASLKKQRENLQQEKWQAALGWAIGLGVFGALACVVLFFLVPSGRKTWIGLFIGCVALIGGAWGMKIVLEYLWAIAIALGAGVIGALIWYLRQEKDARRKVVKFIEGKARQAPELLDDMSRYYDATTKKIIKLDRKQLGLVRSDESGGAAK